MNQESSAVREESIRDEANRKRSEAAKQQPRTEDGTKLAEKPGATTTCGKTCNQYAGSTVKAKASKTNRKRSEAAKERERAEDGTLKVSSSGTTCATTGKHKKHQFREAKAAASKTNRGTVERMDRLVKERPDLAEKVKVGEIHEAAAGPIGRIGPRFWPGRKSARPSWRRRFGSTSGIG